MTIAPRLRFILVGLAFGTACAVSTSSAQIPPETDLYVLIDVGPESPPAACPCITTPFALPAFRPGMGYGSGPTTPNRNAPPSNAERQRHAKDYARDRASIAEDVEDGRAGNPHASVSVARHLSLEAVIVGKPNPVTEEQAAQWWYLAARQEQPDAFLQLAYRYSRGRGVPQDYEAAAHWFYQAATRNDKNAMVALGSLYAAGRGVPQDWNAAVWWWQQAQSLASPLASRFLGDAYVCGLGVGPDNERAVRTYKTAITGGEASSRIQLGHMYSQGCTQPDDEAAVEAYKPAADEGYPEAQIALSELIRQGRGTPMNVNAAYFWARTAERRLPDGELRSLATEQVKAAARQMTAEDIAAGEAMVQVMMAEGAKPLR